MQEMRRKDRLTSEEAAWEILRDCHYAVVAMLDAEDGAPYAIPVSPALVGRAVYFHCANKGQKINDILADNRVCISCVAECETDAPGLTERYRSCVAMANAHIVENPEEKKQALREITRKYAPEFMDKAEHCIEKTLNQTSIVRLDVEQISGKQSKRP